MLVPDAQNLDMASITWAALDNNVIDDLFAAELEELHLADRYEVHRVLGQGGQGTVYLAKDLHMSRDVAIKCAHEQTVAAEINLLSHLSHNGIPQVYDCGVAIDGTHFLVMQFIDGQRLDHYLEMNQPPLSERLRIFTAIAQAIDHAHQNGIVHRDLKPSNIIVTPTGHPFIIDWGLAAKGDPRAVCGSPHFAAPEQLDGQPADHRADIFALGVLLYMVCSGELPYARRVTDFNEFRAVRAGLRRIPLGQVRKDAPKYLDRVSQRASSPQPGARYQSVDALLSVLREHEASVLRQERTLLRKMLKPALCVAILVGGMVGGFYARPYVLDAMQLPEDTAHQHEEFVGPPAADEINWEGINWQADGQPPEQLPQAPQSEQHPDKHEQLGPVNKADDISIPSLSEIMGEPEGFDEMDLDDEASE